MATKNRQKFKQEGNSQPRQGFWQFKKKKESELFRGQNDPSSDTNCCGNLPDEEKKITNTKLNNYQHCILTRDGLSGSLQTGRQDGVRAHTRREQDRE